MIAVVLLVLTLVGLATVVKGVAGVWGRAVDYHYQKLSGQFGKRGDE